MLVIHQHQRGHYQMIRTMASTLMLAALCACGSSGGGGGGSGDSGALVPPFTSFADTKPNQTVVLDGRAATANENNDIVTLNPHSDASVELSYNGDGVLKTLSINTPQSRVTLDRGVCDGPVCAATNASETAVGIFIDPNVAQWNYQSFGVWAEQVGASAFVGGAISVGAPTAALPSVGKATFTGVAGGLYGDSTGSYFTAASMTADVDFGSQSIGFSTEGTKLISTSGGNSFSSTGLNLTGDFSYKSGVNAFIGGVQTVGVGPAGGGPLTGTGSGKFYGPAAQEIGGVYSLQGSGASMIGGFGGKQ
jgi:hypothetical protein